MGNDILRDKFGCYDVENREYYDLRTKSWAFHQGYLYQTELQHVGQDKVRVITYEINPEEKQLKDYFQKLKMMGRYLLKGNIQLPLLCITQNLEECACRIQDKTNVKFYYQHYEIPLSEEMKARERMRQTFSEGEIWYIFYNILNGLRQFQPFGQPSGNLTTKDVIMNNKGELKIKNLLTSPFQTPRSSIFTNYFAPQQLQLMKTLFNNEGVLSRQDYKQKKVNPNLCQVYSLAILIIVIITNYHHLTFYNPPFGVNQTNINNALEKITALGYSKLLTNMIKVMLANHKTRPFPQQIFQTFKPFQYEILHFKPFSFSLHSSEARSSY